MCESLEKLGFYGGRRRTGNQMYFLVVGFKEAWVYRRKEGFSGIYDILPI